MPRRVSARTIIRPIRRRQDACRRSAFLLRARGACFLDGFGCTGLGIGASLGCGTARAGLGSWRVLRILHVLGFGLGFWCGVGGFGSRLAWTRSEEHTSELQSLMRISYAVFCLKKKKN